MKNKELTITISGTSGSGKTTLVELLAEELKFNGFDVENLDTDGYIVSRDIQVNRLHSLLDKNTKIKILSTQLLRKNTK